MNALRLPFVIALLACFATQAVWAEKSALTPDSLLKVDSTPTTPLKPSTQAPYFTTNPPAKFDGQSAKPMRLLAQTVSQGGTLDVDCEKSRITVPYATFEDAGARAHHSDNRNRLQAVRRGQPKLKGEVYGFDAQGNRTQVLLLKADVISMSIFREYACFQQRYATGTPADKAERDRLVQATKAVQALFQNEAIKPLASFQTDGAVKETVLFSNDPNDLPHTAPSQPAPKEIQAQLNARVRAKLARDLAQARIDAPKVHLENEKANGTQNPWMDVLPKSIDELFVPCPAQQYALTPMQAGYKPRMLYSLNCGREAFGYYEQLESGDLSLIKLKGHERFSNGFANFSLWSWTKAFELDILCKRPKSGCSSPYKKGTITFGDSIYMTFIGVYDLMPAQPASLAQLYLVLKFHHDSPFLPTGFVPGAKPGDAWTVRKQTYPDIWLE